MEDNVNKIAAGIVLFNPDNMDRFKESISSILGQIDKIYIFDNSTKALEYDFLSNLVYMTVHENKGIAYALNRIMEAAKDDGYSWVITMDQDSILPDGIIKAYQEKVEQESNLGIICPQVVDSRRTYIEVKEDPKEEYVDFCITSASCTSIKAWKEIGMFDEWLFIDLVDNEFCKRLVVSGYKILKLNKFVMNQEFGKIIPKSPAKQKFWIRLSKIFHNQNIAKFSYHKFVSPMRVYYTNRNIIYVNKKLKMYGSVAYKENYNCNAYLGFLISFCAPSLIRAQKKGKVMKAIFRGIADGRKANVHPWRVGE